MKHFHSLLSCLLSVLFACSACSDNLPAPDKPKAQAERTVIVYMMAENSLNSYSSSDLDEIRQASKTIPANTNLIVYVDDRGLPRIYNVTAKKGFTEWKAFENDHISTDSTVMLHILQDITTNFPARNYGLVLWSHGTGWVPQSRTIGVDNGSNTSGNSGTEMDITTLRGVLEHLPKMEFVLFDACLMQSVEVAYELRNITRYTIGSPTEIHAKGAPYDKIVEPMMKGKLEDIPLQYYQAYNNNGGVVVSLLDCSQMEQLAQATASVVEKFYTAILEKGTDAIQIYSPYSMYASWHPEPYDIKSAMHLALPEADYAQWEQTLQQAVRCQYTTESWTSVYPGYRHSNLTDEAYHTAVSMFIPDAKYANQNWNHKIKNLQWYKAAGWDSIMYLWNEVGENQ